MKYSLTRELDMSRTIDVRLIVSDDITESDIGESLTFMEGRSAAADRARRAVTGAAP